MGSITEGTDVYGSDGEKVGSIVSVGPNYVVVEKGFFFPTDYYIPVSAIAGAQGGRVQLNVPKDAALNQGWDAVPADYGTETVTTTTETVGTVGSYSTDNTLAGAGNAVGGAADAAGDAFGSTAGSAAGLAGAGGAYGADTARTERTIDANETISVPVREETLTATTTARELGEVRIEKDVVSEERVLNVPVTEERVRVERRVVDRAVTGADAGAFQDEVIEVPVYGEEVQLQKQVRVAEEVEIGKEAVQRTEQVAGTVRREEVHVVGDVVEGGSATTGSTTTRTTTTGTTGDVPMTQDVVDGGTGTGRGGGSSTY